MNLRSLLLLLIVLWPCAACAQLTAPSPAPPTTVFHIQRVELQGSTVLQKQLSRLLAPYHDRDVTKPTLDKLAQDILEIYRKADYLLVSVDPPNTVDPGGVVTMHVVEGRLGEIHIQGNRHYATHTLRRFLQAARHEKILRHSTILKAVMLLNELPEVQVTTVFKPGAKVGTSDLTVIVSDRSPHFVGVSYDDYGTATIGEHRAGLSLTYGNLTNNADLLYLSSVFPFPSPAHEPLLQGTYSALIRDDGTRLNFSYANSNIQVGGDFTVLDVRGKADIYTVSLTHPLCRTLVETHDRDNPLIPRTSDLTFAFSLKSIGNFAHAVTTSHDELRELSATYSGTWPLAGARYYMSLTGTMGLGNLLGGTPVGSTTTSRLGASDNFSKVNLDVMRIQKLGPMFLVLRGSAQSARHLLPVQEEFSLGGPDSVRGYQINEQFGDNGFFTSAELRFPIPKTKTAQIGPFFDYGGVSVTRPVPGQRTHVELKGAGLGVSSTFGPYTEGRFDVGFPIGPPGVSNRRVILYGQATSRFQF
jgi:hemolysin activation/secretion protein